MISRRYFKPTLVEFNIQPPEAERLFNAVCQRYETGGERGIYHIIAERAIRAYISGLPIQIEHELIGKLDYIIRRSQNGDT